MINSVIQFLKVVNLFEDVMIVEDVLPLLNLSYFKY